MTQPVFFIHSYFHNVDKNRATRATISAVGGKKFLDF